MFSVPDDVVASLSVQSHKDKHILNITDFMFLLPVLEYHNQTWTWHDLAMSIKNDCKKVLIAQVMLAIWQCVCVCSSVHFNSVEFSSVFCCALGFSQAWPVTFSILLTSACQSLMSRHGTIFTAPAAIF